MNERIEAVARLVYAARCEATRELSQRAEQRPAPSWDELAFGEKEVFRRMASFLLVHVTFTVSVNAADGTAIGSARVRLG